MDVTDHLTDAMGIMHLHRSTTEYTPVGCSFLTLPEGCKCEGLILCDDHPSHYIYTDSFTKILVESRGGKSVKFNTQLSNPRGCCRLRGASGGLAVADIGKKAVVLLDDNFTQTALLDDKIHAMTAPVVCATPVGLICTLDPTSALLRIFDPKKSHTPILTHQLRLGCGNYRFNDVTHMGCHPSKDILNFTEAEQGMVSFLDLRMALVISQVQSVFSSPTSSMLLPDDQLFMCHETEKAVTTRTGPNSVRTWSINSKRLGTLASNACGAVAVVDKAANKIVFLS